MESVTSHHGSYQCTMLNVSRHITIQKTIKQTTAIEVKLCYLHIPPCTVLPTSLIRSATVCYILTCRGINVLTLFQQDSVVH